MADDILQLIERDKIQTYIDLYEQHLCKSVVPYNFLVGQEKWNSIFSLRGSECDALPSNMLKFKLFVPRNGDIKNATIFAISDNDLLQPVR